MNKGDIYIPNPRYKHSLGVYLRDIKKVEIVELCDTRALCKVIEFTDSKTKSIRTSTMNGGGWQGWNPSDGKSNSNWKRGLIYGGTVWLNGYIVLGRSAIIKFVKEVKEEEETINTSINSNLNLLLL